MDTTINPTTDDAVEKLAAQKPTVVIFNGRLLRPSETFVKAQAEGLKTFTPFFAGARRVEGLALPSERTFVVNAGGLLGKGAEAVFKQTGWAPRLYDQVRSHTPQLIHAHFGVCGTLALPMAKALNIPLVVTYHGFDASMTDEYARKDSMTTRVYLRRREPLKQQATRFIAVSNFIKSRLVNQGFPEKNITVHYIGIDTDKFQPNPNVARTDTVLFVGRLVEKKGCEYLIRAMAQVQQQRPEAELVIIGDGPLRAELETLAENTLTRYKFLGLQPSEQVKAWMNKAKVFALPSVTTADGDTEGLPMVILEAQAMGLPVVSTYHAGIPEAIEPGETGFLTQERQWSELTEPILKLLSDHSQWERMGTNAQANVRNNFNLTTQVALLEEIYQHVIAEKS
ncbi:MAG: glycosyltransferase [Cyanobacteria bacterium J06555_13]